MQTPPAHIETARLVLRPWHPDDAAAMRDLVFGGSFDSVREWMTWATREMHERLDDVATRLRGFRLAFEEGRDWNYVITARGTDDFPAGTLIGATALHPRVGPGALEIGYWLRGEATGRGYVTESTTALVDAAFALPHVERVEIRCDPNNAKSAAVPRRLGFRHVTTLAGNTTRPDGTPRDTMVWEIARSSWPTSPDASR